MYVSICCRTLIVADLLAVGVTAGSRAGLNSPALFQFPDELLVLPFASGGGSPCARPSCFYLATS